MLSILNSVTLLPTRHGKETGEQEDKENRKTAKGKVTAKVSTQRDTTPCGTCGIRCCDDEAPRSWIQCQQCGIWFHNECQGLDERGPLTFECILCENTD